MKIKEESLKNIKRIVTSALILWSAYLGNNKVNAQEQNPPPEVSSEVLENYLFADYFEDIDTDLSQEELQVEIFNMINEIYGEIPEEGFGSRDISNELKALIFQSVIQRIAGHGELVTGTSEQILRYLGALEGDVSVREGVDTFDIRNLFDEESVRIERFEQGGRRGVRILFDVTTDSLREFIRENNPDVVNASFTVGTHQILLTREEWVTNREFYEFIQSDPNASPVYIDQPSYSLFVEPDGIAYPHDASGNRLTLYTEREIEDISKTEGSWVTIESGERGYQLIEPYYSPIDSGDDRYPGALDLGSSNREELNNLAREFPDTIFVAAAGNYNSNSEIRGIAPNLIIVGMYYPNIMYAPGIATLYIDYNQINDSEFLRGLGIDSSSEATAVISALIRVFREQNPQLSVEQVVELFINSFSEEASRTVILSRERGDDGERTTLDLNLRVLNIAAIIQGLGSN